MPIAFVGGSATGTSTSTVFQIPAVEAGDLILAHSVRTSSSAAISIPTGFSVLQEIAASSQVFYKFAEAAAAATSSPSTGAGQRHVCVVYRGVDPVTPFGDAQYFRKEFRNSLALAAMAEASPPAAQFVFLLPSNDTPTLLSAANMSAFDLRVSNTGGQAYSVAGPTFAGASLALTNGASIGSTATFVGLVAADAAPQRQRSRLILTPW